MQPTSCSGCWSFLSPFVVLTFFPLPTLLLTASVEATGKQITVNILPRVHKKFTGNETCTCPPPTPTKIKMLALLVLRHFFCRRLAQILSVFPLTTFTRFCNINLGYMCKRLILEMHFSNWYLNPDSSPGSLFGCEKR